MTLIRFGSGTFLTMILVIAFLLAPPTLAQDNSTAIKIDKRSYQLGGIGAFSEMVGVGLKKLALGSPVPSAELDILFPEIEMIAANNGVKAYREDDFLVTDLFDEGLTKGLSLPIIYKGDTLKEYLDLKIMKKTLIATGGYTGENRKEIARQMGRLLSYPETRITSMLNK